jgi:hypothetical protein
MRVIVSVRVRVWFNVVSERLRPRVWDGFILGVSLGLV